MKKAVLRPFYKLCKLIFDCIFNTLAERRRRDNVMIRNFAKGIVCVGISIMISENLNATAEIFDLANCMEEVCVAEQNVIVSKLHKKDGKSEREKLDNVMCNFKMKCIYFFAKNILISIQNQALVNHQDPALLNFFVKQMDSIVNANVSKRNDDLEALKQIFVDTVLICESNKVKRLLPRDLGIDKLSKFQKFSIAMFVTQLTSNGELRTDFSHFFVGGALNILSDDSDLNSKKILDEIIKKIPLNFLKETDY